MNRPACMAAAEYLAWCEANARLLSTHADSPCRDCTPLWHADMVAGGMCDGIPGPRRELLPVELRHLTYAELREVRQSLPWFDPPPVLVTAMHRARWREYQQRRRDAVSA